MASDCRGPEHVGGLWRARIRLTYNVVGTLIVGLSTRLENALRIPCLDAYILPRLAVLPGHEHKACEWQSYARCVYHLCIYTPVIPINNIFQLPPGTEHPHLTLHAHVKAFNPKFITLSRAFPEHGITTTSLEYDYAIYALGSLVPDPLNLWGSPKFHGTKPESIDWLKDNQNVVRKSGSVLVVGGGALGVRECRSLHGSESLANNRRICDGHQRAVY